MAASSVCSAVIMEPPFPSLCCVEMFPLAFDKKSPLCNLVHLLCPSCFFQHADFMPASLSSSLSCLLVCCLHPSSAAGMLGWDKEKAPALSRFECFAFFISMTFFLWVVNTRDKLGFDRGYSNSNPGLSRWPFKNMRFDGWVWYDRIITHCRLNGILVFQMCSRPLTHAHLEILMWPLFALLSSSNLNNNSHIQRKLMWNILASSWNECNANLVSFCSANRNGSQKSNS